MMRPQQVFLLSAVLSAAILAPRLTIAGDIANGQFSIPTISTPVAIDANINDKAWQDATAIALDIEMFPGENIKAPVETTAYIMADNDNLYVAFNALDPKPSEIRAYYRERDKVWADDLVGIKVDTYNDGNKAYQFFVNPFGVQSDSIENELVGRETDAWNVIWDAQGKVTAQGYVVEMAIPLTVFNFEEKPSVQDWGIELVRFYPRDIRHRISNTPKDRQRSCNLCQMSVAQGLAGIKQSSQLQLVPTSTASKSQSRDVEAASEWESDNNSDIGLDLKWAMSPDVSLYATVNPDFSQIEADSGQLNVNNSFSLFNRERRGFFLDDADFFEVPFQNLFYTRNVVAPKAGAKVTGRQGQHSFAVFGAQDKETLFVLPGNLSSTVIDLEDRGTSGAIRYRFDATKNLSLGGLTTLRQSGDYHNYVGAFDIKYRATDNDTFMAMLVGSTTQYPIDMALSQDLEGELAIRGNGSASFGGQSLDFSYQHRERNWNTNLRYRSQSEGFRADLGFVNRVDTEKWVIGAERIWYRENQWINQLRFGGDWDITHSAKGDLIEREQELYVKLNGDYQSFVRFSAYNRDKVGLRRNAYDDGFTNSLAITNNSDIFNEYGIWMWSEITPLAGVSARLFVEDSREIDLANNRLADRLRIHPEFDWNISEHLLLKVIHRYQTMDSDSGRLFTANLTDLRLTYQFNIRSSLRFSAINLDLSRDPNEYLFSEVDSTTKSLSTQLLYSYKVNPQSLVYLGYSDHGFQNDDLAKISKDQRSVFVKFSYAWLN